LKWNEGRSLSVQFIGCGAALCIQYRLHSSEEDI
jgi:hypothetical protein